MENLEQEIEGVKDPGDDNKVEVPKVQVPSAGENEEQNLNLKNVEDLIHEKIESTLVDKLQEGIFKAFDKLSAKHKKEVDDLKTQLKDLEDKLPKTITPNKSSIKGYYDFNENTREFINQAAKDDYSRAKETLRMVNSIFK